MALSGSMGRDLTTALGDINNYSHQVFLMTLKAPVCLSSYILFLLFLLFLLHLLILVAPGALCIWACLRSINYVIPLPCVTGLPQLHDTWLGVVSTMASCPGSVVPGNQQY